MIHPLPLNDATNDVQAAMEKMIRACDYGHRQLLRLRPAQHLIQRDRIIQLTMNDDGVLLHGLDRPLARRRADKHHALDTLTQLIQTLRHARLYQRAKRKPRQHQCAVLFILTPRPLNHRQCIVGFAIARIVLTRALSHAAEIKTHGHVAQAAEGFRQRLRDFVVHRTAKQRMRMRDNRQAARVGLRLAQSRHINLYLNRADIALDQQALCLVVQYRHIIQRPPTSASPRDHSANVRSKFRPNHCDRHIDTKHCRGKPRTPALARSDPSSPLC